MEGSSIPQQSQHMTLNSSHPSNADFSGIQK